MSLSKRSNVAFHISVAYKRLMCYIKWQTMKTPLAMEKSKNLFEKIVVSHSTVLVRQLEGVDPCLQQNKVKNLELAIKYLDGIIVKPQEYFSFYRYVGKPTRRRGFVEGLELSRGKTGSAVGGGLCQIANMLHWMLLHSDLTITERHHHSVDIFPDNDRKIPFGTGATLFFNFKDFCFSNNTKKSYQLHLYIDGDKLCGQILTDSQDCEEFEVEERNHRFEKIGDEFHRLNELWQINLKDGSEKLLFKNDSVTMYEPSLDAVFTSN